MAITVSGCFGSRNRKLEGLRPDYSALMKQPCCRKNDARFVVLDVMISGCFLPRTFCSSSNSTDLKLLD